MLNDIFPALAITPQRDCTSSDTATDWGLLSAFCPPVNVRIPLYAPGNNIWLETVKRIDVVKPGATIPEVGFTPSQFKVSINGICPSVETVGALPLTDQYNGRDPGLLTVNNRIAGSGPPSVAINDRTGGDTTSTAPKSVCSGNTDILTWTGM